MPAEADTPPFQRAWEGRCLELFLGCLHFKRNACLLFKIEHHKVFIVKTNVVPRSNHGDSLAFIPPDFSKRLLMYICLSVTSHAWILPLTAHPSMPQFSNLCSGDSYNPSQFAYIVSGKK